MKKANSIFYNLGMLLMVFSLFPFLLIYYPFISFFFAPAPAKTQTVKKGFHIEIPKIKVVSKIIPNVDPWNQQQYRKTLHEGIAQAKGTKLPGEKGTVFLFAHSSDTPWNATRYNIPFFFLGNLEKNDEITIFKNGREYKYKVREKKIVQPSETKYLKETKKDQLILQTCWPIGMTFQRLLVFADPKN